MKIGYYIKKAALENDSRIEGILAQLERGGVASYRIRCCSCVQPGTAMMLSFGGDGMFLSAAHIVAEAGLPILGVNLGRMGFLAANKPGTVAGDILGGAWTVENLDMLKVDCGNLNIPDFWPYAVNELSLHRDTAEMLGVDVQVDGKPLPTYWADGVLVATSAGSTAYSLSAGGPICLPAAPVHLITPVAPHNLNLRPLVVPAESRIRLSGKSRSGRMLLTLDNRSWSVPCGTVVTVESAGFPLKRVQLGESAFIEALKSRFFWGQDVRNASE